MRSDKVGSLRQAEPLLGQAQSNVRPAPVTFPMRCARTRSPEPSATAMGGRASPAVSSNPTSQDLLAKVSERHAVLLEACWPIGPPCGLGRSVGERRRGLRVRM